MKFNLAITLCLAVILSSCSTNSITERAAQLNTAKPHKIVIAHRGASGYLPEHSLAAKAMAHAMDVDYIEQDVVMSKDNHLIVLHDPYLDRVTDVVQVFPNRWRMIFGEKRWLAIDFTLQEIKKLRMTEGFTIDPITHQKHANFPDRFPLFKSSFHVSTLEEEIELIQGLNISRHKNIGIYVEIKAPWFHRLEGKDISLALLKTLKDYGYSNKNDRAYVQCFDPDETKRIHDQLLPQLKMNLKLVQLIAETSWHETMRMKEGKLTPYDYQWMFEKGGMKRISQFADAIGPWKAMLVSPDSSLNHVIASEMLNRAHQQGLAIHPYTFRREANKIPPYAQDFDDLLDIFLYQFNVDGIFTDFPDLAVKFIQQMEH